MVNLLKSLGNRKKLKISFWQLLCRSKNIPGVELCCNQKKKAEPKILKLIDKGAALVEEQLDVCSLITLR